MDYCTIGNVPTGIYSQNSASYYNITPSYCLDSIGTFPFLDLPQQKFCFNMPIFDNSWFNSFNFGQSFNTGFNNNLFSFNNIIPFNFNFGLSSISNTPSKPSSSVVTASESHTVPVTRNANGTIARPSDGCTTEWWESLGYDPVMGKKLANDAVGHCPYVWDHDCVGYTRKTINRLYGTNFANAGSAKDFGANILEQPELKGKFKRIDVTGLKNSDFPDGAIVIWRPGQPGYTKGAAGVHGHGAIVSNNKCYSDNVSRNLTTYSEVWIPVKS